MSQWKWAKNRLIYNNHDQPCTVYIQFMIHVTENPQLDLYEI